MQSNLIPAHRLWMAVATVMLADAFQTLPRGVAMVTTTAAPWAILVAGLAAFLLFWPAASFLARRPGRSLVHIFQEAGGRPLAILFTLLFGAYTIAAGGMSLRQVSEMAITAIYPHTPQTFLMSTLLGTAALGAAVPPAALVWVAASCTWPFAVGILVVLIGNLGWGKAALILPLTGPGLLPVSTRILPLTSYFGELTYVGILAGSLSTAKHLVSSAAKTTSLAAITWGLVIMLHIMVFSIPGSLALAYPLFEMTRNVSGGRFLERVDSLWILVWVFGSGARLATALMAASLLFKDAFRLPTHRIAVLPLAAAVLAAALFPSNHEGAITTETFLIRQWGFVITLLVPCAVALLVRLRRRKQHA